MKTMFCLVLLSALVSTAAYAREPHVQCAQFHHNDDGSWSPIAPMTLTGPKGSFKIIPGLEFRDGTKLMGADFGTALDSKCARPDDEN